MRPYEVMLIFDASLEEETIRAAVDRFAEFIRTRGGDPGRIDRWGRRRFAYELRHRWEGYYVLMEFTADVELEEELHRMLSLADEVLRHKVIRIPEAALKARAAPAAAPAAAEAQEGRQKMSGNNITILGNITRDPELRFTPSGQ